MKIIDMSSVVSSDTLCCYASITGQYNYFKIDEDDLLDVSENGAPLIVADRIWQSTANNLVIPDGLVCDVEWFTDFEEGLIVTKGCLSGEGIKDLIESPDCHATAIKVTGKQDGYRYEWEGE